MYGKYAGDGINEYAVTKEEHRQIRDALSKNLEVVVDATNLNIKTLKKLQSIAQEFGCFTHVESFTISVEEAIARDAVRDKKVGEAVIRMFAERYNIK
jgi:predicted kinase